MVGQGFSVLRKVFLPSILAILAYGFWISPDFKEIAAGVAIFLFGMLSLEEGFKVFTGGLLERLLRRTTDKLWKSISFGILSTTIMQSSSLVSVITISFLSAGLLDLAAGIGIIFGANLGTTTGAWLVAGLGLKVKISAYAMPMLVFGIVLIFQKSKNLKGIGYVLSGLGFLFLGIHHMKEGFEAFKDAIDLSAYAVPGIAGLLIFTLIGVLATVVMQSSHATLVLIITALAAHQITYDNALALAIGANVGTTITAILGAMSARIEGKRLAAAHLVFNVVTGALALIFIQYFLMAVDAISIEVGIASDNYTMKLAVFHTLFNLVGLIVMVPFTGMLVRTLESSFKSPKADVEKPLYLNDAVLGMPDASVQATRSEIRNILEKSIDLIAQTVGLDIVALQSEQKLKDLVDAAVKVPELNVDEVYEAQIKGLHSAVIAFIARAAGASWAGGTDGLYRLRISSRSIVEAVKAAKHLQKNLIRNVGSDNEAVRRRYRALRVQVGSLLRDVSRISAETDPSLALLSLDGMKVGVEEADAQMNARLDRLIREDEISPMLATSLMNDSGYVYELGQALITTLEGLYAPESEPHSRTDYSIRLEEQAIEDAATADIRLDGLDEEEDA